MLTQERTADDIIDWLSRFAAELVGQPIDDFADDLEVTGQMNYQPYYRRVESMPCTPIYSRSRKIMMAQAAITPDVQ